MEYSFLFLIGTYAEDGENINKWNVNSEKKTLEKMEVGQKDHMDICSHMKAILYNWTQKNLSTISNQMFLQMFLDRTLMTNYPWYSFIAENTRISSNDSVLQKFPMQWEERRGNL